MTIFVDTSALFAILDADDRNHRVARERWTEMLENGESLLTSNYVVVESISLIGRTLGPAAIRVFETTVVPVLDIFWVGEELHRQGTSALLIAGQRDLSLVDCVSFELMRRLGVRTAFAFDKHFLQQGFQTA